MGTSDACPIHGVKYVEHSHGLTLDCQGCADFVDDPARIEAAFPGIAALSSAWGSARGRAGICLRSGTFQDPQPVCPEFAARTGAPASSRLRRRNSGTDIPGRRG